MQHREKPNLRGIMVAEAGLDRLARLTQLKELSRYRAKVTQAGLEKLSRLPRLARLNRRYSRVNLGGVPALRAALPRRASMSGASSTGGQSHSAPPWAMRPSSTRRLLHVFTIK
jgi:hypothetical protein